MAVKTAVGGRGDDWGKWLPVALALISAGVLPKKWKLPVAAAMILWKLLG
jgi:hypothetical protein